MNESRNDDDKKRLMYFTLRVKRPLSNKEMSHINKIEDPTHRYWELERQSLLFEIAVLAYSVEDAVSRLRAMLRSPELIIERN